MKFTETFDPHKLNYILQNKEKFQFRIYEDDYDPIATAERYLRKSTDGKIKVSYHQPHHRNFGRFYADNGISLQSLCREIRHTIAAEFYDDIDMVNAHPVILYQLCQKHDIECEKLRDYVENREERIAEVIEKNPQLDRDSVKQMFLSILNRGNKAYDEIKNKPQFLKRFKSEINDIQGDLSEKYPTEYEFRKKTKPENPLGSTMNALLCENENQILQRVVEFYISRGCISDDCVLCFDGVMIPKNVETETLITSCQEYVYEKTGYVITLKVKPMNEGLEVPEQVPEFREFIPFDPKDSFTWLDFDEKYRGRVFTSQQEVIEQTREDMNRVFAKVEQGTGFVIKKTDAKDNLHDIIDAKANFSDLYFLYQDDEKQREMGIKRYLQLFSNDLNRYRSIDFAPNNTDPRLFNLWSGFTARLVDKPQLDQVELILKHIQDVYCDGCQISYEYFLDLLYYILKYPEKPLGVATFIFSKRHGSGKNIILDFLEEFVFGKALSHYTAGLENVLEKHNHLLKSKKIVIVDELASASDKFMNNFDRLKSMLTGPRLEINPKGVNQYTIKNVLAWFLISNHDDCLRLEPSDRRYFCLNVSEKYIGNTQYFNRLASTFNQDTGDAFYSYILQRGDARDINIRTPPMNKFKREIISKGWSSSVRFLFELSQRDTEGKTDDSDDDDDSLVTGAVLYRKYTEWCQANHEKQKSNAKFAADIKTYITKTRDGGGTRYDLTTISIKS